MRILKAALLTCVLLMAAAISPAHAALPLAIEKTVPRGGVVILFAINAYQSVRGCTPLHQGAVDTSPKAKLGSIETEVVTRVMDGPCGKAPYNIQVVKYRAGDTSGEEDFELFYFYSYQTGGQERIKVKIHVSGNALPTKQKSVASPNSKSVAVPTSPPVSSPRVAAKASANFAGNYVNNFGNQIRVNNEFVYFTGVWSGVSVKNKPFTVMQNSNGRLVWASYICEGDSLSFVCTHQTTKEQRLYRLIH